MKPQIVSLRCTLKNATGRLISTSYSRDVMTEALDPSHSELPVLARHLKNLQSGERRRISLKADDAYGLYDPSLTFVAKRSEFPRGSRIRPGDRVRLQDDQGQIRNFRVTEAQGEELFLDANHDLAGQDLVFEFEVIEAREATDEEIHESASPGPDSHLH